MHRGLQSLRGGGKSSHLRFVTHKISPLSQMETNNDDGGMGYTSGASRTLSVTTGMGFMAMFLWTLLSLL